MDDGAIFQIAQVFVSDDRGVARQLYGPAGLAVSPDGTLVRRARSLRS